MFEDEEVIKLCIRNSITVEQYFFMWLVRKQDFNEPDSKSLAKQYVKLVKAFDLDMVRDLGMKGLVDDFNSPGKSNPELYVLKPKAEAFFTDEDSGEELWKAYPATFPLGDKNTKFVARTGGPKDDLLDDYLQAIGFSRKKHQFAMKMLKEYTRLVHEGKLNGHKISDWIRQQMWETVADYLKEAKTVQTYDPTEDI